jgi:hypothetical protein
MIECGCGAPFLLEPADPVWIAGEGSGQDFQRDVTTELGVPSSVYLAL